eukprot:14283102-Alexandrium_andersonii.AAC.1
MLLVSVGLGAADPHDAPLAHPCHGQLWVLPDPFGSPRAHGAYLGLPGERQPPTRRLPSTLAT